MRTEQGSITRVPNPKRQAAGARNRLLRRGLTAAGRDKLRAAIRVHRPWEQSTGPVTPAGKAIAAQNGAYRQKGLVSIREARRQITIAEGMARSLIAMRRQL
jgi:hypothetical protein